MTRQRRTVQQAMLDFERQCNEDYDVRQLCRSLLLYALRNGGRIPMPIVRALARRIGVEVTA